MPRRRQGGRCQSRERRRRRQIGSRRRRENFLIPGGRRTWRELRTKRWPPLKLKCILETRLVVRIWAFFYLGMRKRKYIQQRRPLLLSESEWTSCMCLLQCLHIHENRQTQTAAASQYKVPTNATHVLPLRGGSGILTIRIDPPSSSLPWLLPN